MPAPAWSYGVLRQDARFHPASSQPVKPLAKMQLGSALHLLWIADLCTNCQLAGIPGRLLLFVMTVAICCIPSVADHSHKIQERTMSAQAKPPAEAALGLL